MDFLNMRGQESMRLKVVVVLAFNSYSCYL